MNKNSIRIQIIQSNLLYLLLININQNNMIHSIDNSDDEVEHVESGPTLEDVEKMGAATRAFFVFMAAAVAFFESRQDAQGSEEFEIGRSMAKLRIARKREAELLLDATPKPNRPFDPINAANYSKAMEENRLEMVRINIGLNASFLSILSEAGPRVHQVKRGPSCSPAGR